MTFRGNELETRARCRRPIVGAPTPTGVLRCNAAAAEDEKALRAPLVRLAASGPITNPARMQLEPPIERYKDDAPNGGGAKTKLGRIGQRGAEPRTPNGLSMGFWDWIVGKLAFDPNAKLPPHRPAPRTRAATQGPAGAAVAVQEPPESTEECPPVPGPAEWWAPEGATLTEPPPLQRPDLDTESRVLENMLVSHFDGHDLTLPPLLHVAESVLPKLRDPDCSLPETARELSEDQVIAAGILRMANSPLYRGLHKITALPAAVTRLGLTALRTLLMHESLRAAMFYRKGHTNEFARILWTRSLASATIMRGLSEFTSVDKEDGFLIGLLHDIGNVIVLRIVHGDGRLPRYEVDLDTFEYLCAETHQEFGELIADAWSLPANLKVLLSDHHNYPAHDDPLCTPRLQLQVTDMIASLLGFAPYQPYNLLECRAVQDLNLASHPKFLPFLKNLPDDVNETIGAL